MSEPIQHVIVFDKRGQRGCVYDTACTEGQIRQSVTRARTKGYSNVRAVLAKAHMREFSP